MSALKNSTPNLLRTLKPEASVSAEAVNQAAVEAQERWPLLKSIRPEKWLLAPKLLDNEKKTRLAVDAPVSAPKIAPRAASSIDLRLAQGLQRMTVNLSPRVDTVTPEPIADIVRVAPVKLVESVKELPVVQAVETVHTEPANANDESIQAVLSRVLQAGERTVQTTPANGLKQPGFLSRLGKR
jgi:hypothetical protein